MKLILVRHGQSEYNFENRFTGLADPDLTPKGREEAHLVGQFLKTQKIEIAFVSPLQRTRHTLKIIQEEMALKILKIIETPHLNPRNYGALTGMNKAQAARKFGAENILLWRRSYQIPPPEGESLKETTTRVGAYYQEHIFPYLQKHNVLIVGHGNTLRALCMHLENLTPNAIKKRELPNAVPIIYEL